MEVLTQIINFIMRLIEMIKALFDRGDDPDADEKDKDKTKK